MNYFKSSFVIEFETNGLKIYGTKLEFTKPYKKEKISEKVNILADITQIKLNEIQTGTGELYY